MSIAVEICVAGVESALAAGEGGADRVELCEYLAVGGITPSAGAIKAACGKLTIPVHVLIRPRGGHFRASDLEMEIMREDIATARSLGAAGVVFGVLDETEAVDRERTARLVEAARPLSVTFHKAFDECPEPEQALETLVGLGVERVLTSGQQTSAIAGIDLLTRLTKQARGRIVVMAGGAINEADAATLVRAGIREIHIGSSVCEGGLTRAAKVRSAIGVVRSHS